MNFLNVILNTALVFAAYCIGAVGGCLYGRKDTMRRAQQLLDAWAEETGSPRIRLRWDGDEFDPGE